MQEIKNGVRVQVIDSGRPCSGTVNGPVWLVAYTNRHPADFQARIPVSLDDGRILDVAQGNLVAVLNGDAAATREP